MSDTPIEAFIHLVQDTAATLRNQPGVVPVEVIQDLEVFTKERLIPIWHREQKSARNPYVLSVVGLTNVGKSTLMEALLGFPVAPRKNGPATAIPVEYKHNCTWCIRIQYRASRRPPDHNQYGDAQTLGRDLATKVLDVGAVQAAEIAWVTVSGPMEMLVHGLHLADTPGFGAAQVGNDDGSHQQRLEEFVSKVVDRVYFCIAAGAKWAVSDIERDFYQKFSHLCGHIVVTKWEGQVGEEEVYRNQYKRLFPGADFLFVNARRAMRGVGQSYELDKLKEIIASYATPERRLAMCDPELLLAWRDINEHMENVHRLFSIPWRLDVLRQFAYICSNHSRLDEMKADLIARIHRGAA